MRYPSAGNATKACKLGPSLVVVMNLAMRHGVLCWHAGFSFLWPALQLRHCMPQGRSLPSTLVMFNKSDNQANPRSPEDKKNYKSSGILGKSEGVPLHCHPAHVAAGEQGCVWWAGTDPQPTRRCQHAPSEPPGTPSSWHLTPKYSNQLRISLSQCTCLIQVCFDNNYIQRGYYG